MMRGFRCPSELQVVDWLLGRLPAWERDWTEAHLRYCPKCRETERLWRRLLAMPETPPQAPGAPHLPGPQLKRRLRLSFAANRWRTRFGTRRVQAAAAAVFLGFAFASWLVTAVFRSADGDGWPDAGQAAFADGDMIRMMDIAARPQTVRYPLLPPEPSGRAKGFVWVDKSGDELLLLVDGEKAAVGRDYQAWLVYGGDRWNAGVLRWLNGKAYLRYQGETVRQAEGVAVSLEPKGGSVRPSGPDAAWAYIGEADVGNRG